MTGAESARAGHACLARNCGHPDSDHTLTPELAGPFETVVWCSACHRHETRSPRGWLPLLGRSARHPHRRAGRAA